MTEMAAARRPSYRERQRERLKATLNRTALEMFAERGYDGVTTDEIANEVGISPSTFFRYVASKEELLTEPLLRGRTEIVEAFAARPAGEAVTEGLAQSILHRIQQFAGEAALMQVWRRAMATAPEPVQRTSFISRNERRKLVGLVADRLGTDSVTDLRPGVLVQVTLAAAEHAYDRWLHDESSVSLYELTSEALTCAGAVVHQAGAGSPAFTSRRRNP